MSYDKAMTPSGAWKETHNSNKRNGAGLYRRSMSGAIMPIERKGFFARWFK